MGDQYRLAEARGDRRGGMADMDYERAAADRDAVDPFRRQAEIMCYRPRSPTAAGSPKRDRESLCHGRRRVGDAAERMR
jgi:hypothetical protein